MYTGGLMSRLQRAWAEARGGGVRLPVGAEGVIGFYCRHAITKMNNWRGFGPHVPGIGRLPASSGVQANHCKRLGQALVEALGRDFSDIARPAADDGEDDVGGCGEAVPLRGLEALEVETVAALHLRAMSAYDGVLNEALAAANREGEANQAEERQRIFGISKADSDVE